ncbi:DUF4374 domain-containing protein [Tunicatimonas pelagia]|uniref:DUF4374 domain-containing protein n=1 Tax=Tunicatimonas pelagia TaxID=931531 RepID=UPI002666D13A|nr:DUF4374 domain-containing protein [Tunicatimonas pelagia]WKN43001.1 DUF4374 domain-containing protein [Tunicatimonas pelagia]
MKTIQKSVLYLFLALFSLACNDNGDPGPVTSETASGITMSLKTTGGDETEFIINEARDSILMGEISAVGTGIEQTGWRFYYPVGKTLFAAGYSDDNQCTGYVANEEGIIVEQGAFIFDVPLQMFGATDDEQTLLAMEIPRAGFAKKQLYLVDAASVQVTEKIALEVFQSTTDSLLSRPTSLQVRDDKLFIPFQKLDVDGNFTTPRADTAFVAIFSYPNVGDAPEKIITDPRTSNIGVDGMTTGLIEADNGDLYSFSCGAAMAGFAPASTKPSGILRIPSGATEFDPDYFFNVEAATDGGKLFWFDYVGNNKAIARILTGDDGPAWSAYGRDIFNQQLVIIDLVSQTITPVTDDTGTALPLHAKRYTSPVLVEDGQVLVSVETATEAYVYEVNVADATAQRGAKIAGKTIKGFYRL